MDRRFGCRDSWVYIDFSAECEAVSLAVRCAEETNIATVVDTLLARAIRTFFALLKQILPLSWDSSTPFNNFAAEIELLE